MTYKEVKVHVLRCVFGLFTEKGMKFSEFENLGREDGPGRRTKL